MKQTGTSKLRLGPFKFEVANVTAGAAVALFFVFMVIGIAVLVAFTWVFIHNFMLISQGDFSWINVLWILISSYYFISVASNHD